MDLSDFLDKKPDKKRLIVTGTIIIIFAILAGWYFYNKNFKTGEKRLLTNEEKMEILKNLKTPTEEELPTAERMKILESLNTPTEKDFSEKTRIKILESLTP
ncbi:MAG: hypothetical protein HYW71_00590 [Candidatus Niyogibacteria bacterium]|nr:hypothetical protein [Candidatus Niyogibacteria bacterium]